MPDKCSQFQFDQSDWPRRIRRSPAGSECAEQKSVRDEIVGEGENGLIFLIQFN